jgi:hypothetical protein
MYVWTVKRIVFRARGPAEASESDVNVWRSRRTWMVKGSRGLAGEDAREVAVVVGAYKALSWNRAGAVWMKREVRSIGVFGVRWSK